MYHTYVLCSDTTGSLYVGSTGDLERCLTEHNLNMASATKNRGPWRLIYSEAHATRGAAMKGERYFKTGKGREELSGLTGRGR